MGPVWAQQASKPVLAHIRGAHHWQSLASSWWRVVSSETCSLPTQHHHATQPGDCEDEPWQWWTQASALMSRGTRCFGPRSCSEPQHRLLLAARRAQWQSALCKHFSAVVQGASGVDDGQVECASSWVRAQACWPRRLGQRTCLRATRPRCPVCSPAARGLGPHAWGWPSDQQSCTHNKSSSTLNLNNTRVTRRCLCASRKGVPGSAPLPLPLSALCISTLAQNLTLWPWAPPSLSFSQVCRRCAFHWLEI